jgi:hypothetical protein
MELLNIGMRGVRREGKIGLDSAVSAQFSTVPTASCFLPIFFSFFPSLTLFIYFYF